MTVARSGPATGASKITPSDSNEISSASFWPRSIYVGASGDVACIFRDSSASVLMGSVGIGEHPWALRKVYSSSTTAASLIALY